MRSRYILLLWQKRINQHAISYKTFKVLTRQVLVSVTGKEKERKVHTSGNSGR